MGRGGAAASGGGPGWLPTTVGLAVLAMAGFGIGFLAGGLWEEPDLVLRHLLGGSAPVAWGPGEGAEQHAGSTGGGSGPDSGAVAHGSGEPAVLPPVAMAPPGPRIAVQVGAFSDSGSAERLSDRLRNKGYAAYLAPGAERGEARWRVRVGPYSTREAAERAAARLKAEEKLPTWVLDEDAAGG